MAERVEGSTISLLPRADVIAKSGERDYALAFARIENHYSSTRASWRKAS
ncbi:hypothetical protein ACU686_21025 [Yinghuangia aomiensis]